MKYFMVASGTVEADSDAEIVAIAKIAESDPGDAVAPHVRVTEDGTDRVVYETKPA